MIRSHIDLLDWPCKTNHKTEFHISRKQKLPFLHLFRRKTPFRFRFHFHQKNSVSISVPQISVFVFIFSFRFRFSVEKSESFRSTFIPTLTDELSIQLHLETDLLAAVYQ
jgi:hypothetical protein